VTSRPVKSVVDAVSTLEGAGFPVRRPFPTRTLMQVDPFLLLDHLGPVNWGPGEAVGAPDHPHRGFETVTYLLAGAMRHRDSGGHAGRLGPGDVQWMTAGAGVVHSELPDEKFDRAGGVMHGFQIWVNLPARDKMIPPHYQEIPSARIPEASTPDGKARVRVIAGEALGRSAVIATRTPIALQHWILEPGAGVEQPVAESYNALAYVLAGDARVAGRMIREGQMAILGKGDAVSLECEAGAGTRGELLLLAGEPLDEPVARQGPFVMNTAAEIRQAFLDYQSGRMGEIATA
jgi:quercetin 2,3-dioxygenase